MATEHRVPLTASMLSVLERAAANRTGALVFPGLAPGRPLHPRTLFTFFEHRSGVTVHGMRASFSTWAAETTLFPVEVREACLAHSIGSAVLKAYARTSFFDRRRELMEQWSAFVEGGDPS